MEWVETAARTLAEAKEAALAQLGVDETDAEIVVVSEPRPGLFGRTRGEARIRARVRPTQPRPKRGRERARSGRRRTPTSSSAGRVQAADQADAGSVPDVDRDRGGSTNDPAHDRQPAPGSEARREERGPTAQTAAPTGHRRSRSRSRSRSRQRTPSTEVAGSAVDWGTAPPTASRPSKLPERPGGDLTPTEPVQASRDIVDEEEETAMAEMSLQQQGDAARSFVVGVVERLGIAAQVELRPVDEETITVAVDGEQVGPLVGHGGAALAALQELTRTYVQKLTGGQSDRIMVDVAGYRERRVAALQRFARKIAEEVLETGEPRALEPMAAADRKVVHDTVNEIEGVTTRSEGDEPRRYIVIVPAGPATDA